ncbi:hypothetical protein WR25_07667 [Diploscapter pachys]|uniref:Carboxypeptidase n=1 Tax=Diploscapter pachys TaxID=2018661 RepID=A0A2A2LVP2_9BILA|nr:hypothetical protein WR25_07667 [Diploscapter pachys]
MFIWLLVSLFGLVAGGAHNSVNTWSGVLQYDEDWGYVDIRANAHTFWWLYAVKPANNRPLFVWLQLQVADMVYVDNPVGAGFSYVDANSALTKNITDIGNDLLAWLRQFLVVHSEYRSRPFYIFCESYGGKMTAEFGRQIANAIDAGTLTLNFRGVALGDSWISAMDYVNTWGPYLYANSFLDDNQLAEVQKQAGVCQSLVDKGLWSEATNCWGTMEDLIGVETADVSWYNILKYGGQDDWSITRAKRSKEDVLAQAGAVFNYQSGDFMTPNYATVDELLSKNYAVVVYNGNEDLICNTIGTLRWMNRLQWPSYGTFNKTERVHFKTTSFPLAGYYKKYKNLSMYWILRAGHMFPYDTPEAAFYMLTKIVSDYNQ